MSNSISLICLIIRKNSKNYTTDGTAVYRPSSNNPANKYFEFRLFDSGSNKNIHSFEEGDVVMFSGKFVYRKDVGGDCPMFVCFNSIYLKFS